MEDNLSTGTNIDRGTKVDNPSTRIDTDVEIDNLDIAADNPDKWTDINTRTNNQNTVVDNLGITADNLNIAIDNLGKIVDNPGKTADNPSTETNADVETDDLGIAISNKICAIPFFALHYALFLLISSSELVTTFLPSSLPFLSLITL